MISKRLNSFKFAIKGLIDLFKNTPNAKIHLIMAIAVVICGFIFNISITEWCLCILSIGFVITAEALNTALEYLVDLVSPDFNPLAGKAKDVAAAAVLVAAICAATVGTIVFLPKGWITFMNFIN